MNTPDSLVDPVVVAATPEDPPHPPLPKRRSEDLQNYGPPPADTQDLTALPASPTTLMPTPAAGPSTRLEKVTKPKRIPRPSTSARSGPSNDRSRKVEKPTDEELSAHFSTPGAMNAYLASKWVNLSELKRLELAGGASSGHLDAGRRWSLLRL